MATGGAVEEAKGPHGMAAILAVAVIPKRLSSVANSATAGVRRPMFVSAIEFLKTRIPLQLAKVTIC